MFPDRDCACPQKEQISQFSSTFYQARLLRHLQSLLEKADFTFTDALVTSRLGYSDALKDGPENSTAVGPRNNLETMQWAQW